MCHSFCLDWKFFEDKDHLSYCLWIQLAWGEFYMEGQILFYAVVS